MEQVTITISTGNDAFADEPATELARILRKLADDLESMGMTEDARLRDINGNIVGHFQVA